MSSSNGFANLGEGPCCEEVYKINEYAAAKNAVIATGVIYRLEISTALVIRRISLIRLILGGAAMFVADMTNHNSVIVGKIFNIPLVMYILRV